MTADIMSKYNTYITYLNSIGVDPFLIESSTIINSAVKTNNELNFDTSNVISGPSGELIKINYDTNDIEVYKREERFYLLKVIDLKTGELKNEILGEINFLDDIDFYGHFFYNKVLDFEEKDYSQVRREIFKDKIKYSSLKLEEKNRLIKEELPNLKESISKYLKDFYAHDAVRKIIDKIDESYHFMDNYKLFESDELNLDTLWLINNKLKLDLLKKENETFDAITIFPLVDLVLDYSKYDREEENKVVESCNVIMNDVYDHINKFYDHRSSVRKHNYYLDAELKAIKRHTKLFLRRTKELDDEEK